MLQSTSNLRATLKVASVQVELTYLAQQRQEKHESEYKKSRIEYWRASIAVDSEKVQVDVNEIDVKDGHERVLSCNKLDPHRNTSEEQSTQRGA
jgi:hypothetical protein